MGVTYHEQEGTFIFDFEHDGTDDIISLTGNGYQVEAFSKCFYYGYEFADTIDGNVRSAFIKYVKFTEDLKSQSNLTHFIQKAINDLSRNVTHRYVAACFGGVTSF